MAKNGKQVKSAKRAVPISPLLAGVGIGFAWAALHAPGGRTQVLDLVVWFIQAVAAGVLAAGGILIGLAVVGYAAGGARLLGQKLGSR